MNNTYKLYLNKKQINKVNSTSSCPFRPYGKIYQYPSVLLPPRFIEWCEKAGVIPIDVLPGHSSKYGHGNCTICGSSHMRDICIYQVVDTEDAVLFAVCWHCMMMDDTNIIGNHFVPNNIYWSLLPKLPDIFEVWCRERHYIPIDILWGCTPYNGSGCCYSCHTMDMTNPFIFQMRNDTSPYKYYAVCMYCVYNTEINSDDYYDDVRKCFMNNSE